MTTFVEHHPSSTTHYLLLNWSLILPNLNSYNSLTLERCTICLFLHHVGSLFSRNSNFFIFLFDLSHWRIGNNTYIKLFTGVLKFEFTKIPKFSLLNCKKHTSFLVMQFFLNLKLSLKEVKKIYTYLIWICL